MTSTLTYQPYTVNTSSTTYTITSGTTIPSNIVWQNNSTVGEKELQVNGDANITGDLKIAGVSIKETLDRIEDRLAILHPNTELEQRWEKLRDLRKQYMALEKEILEKEKIWDILKE